MAAVTFLRDVEDVEGTKRRKRDVGSEREKKKTRLKREPMSHGDARDRK